MPTSTRRIRIAPAIICALTLVAAACGDETPVSRVGGEGVASLHDDEPAATIQDDADLEAPTDPEDAFSLFDECMADHGVDGPGGVVFSTDGDVSDGDVKIEVRRDGADGGDAQDETWTFDDVDLEAFEEANKACKGHLANIDLGFDLTPEQEAALEDAQLEFADCMRDQGIEMPDVVGHALPGIAVGGSEGDSGDAPSAQFTVDDPDFDIDAFNEAADVCNAVYESYDQLDGLFGTGR